MTTRTPLEVLKLHMEWKRDSTVPMIEMLELEDNLEAVGLIHDIDNFRAVAGTDHVLVGTTHIYFLPMVVTAIRVEWKVRTGFCNPIHVALDPDWQREVDHLYDLAQPDGRLMTTEIAGLKGEWLISFYPQTR